MKKGTLLQTSLIICLWFILPDVYGQVKSKSILTKVLSSKIKIVPGTVQTMVQTSVLPWMQAPFMSPKGIQQIQQGKQPNFYDIKAAHDSYMIQQKKSGAEVEDDIFGRWANYWEPRVYPSGQFPPLDAVNVQVKQYLAAKSNQNQTNRMTASAWSAIGPYGLPPSGTNGYDAGRGSGRVNCITFDPSNANIIWTGFPAGGLWKTTDGGNTWNNAASFTNSNGVSSIVISPSTPSTMYLADGDADEGSHSPSQGVFKSTDGGVTWNFTGLKWNLSDQSRIYKLLVHPTNPNILIVAATNGLWRTTDGGTTFSKVTYNYQGSNYTGGTFTDLKFKPGDPNTVYASRFFGGSSASGINTSTDGGATFGTDVSLSTDVGRITLGVSAADPSAVYALCGNVTNRTFYGLYKSSDAGVSFNAQSNSPNIFGYAIDGSDQEGQEEYTLSMAVSPTNANNLFVGTVNQWKSTDGGATWSIMSFWTNNTQNVANCHADVHALEINPLNSIMYSGNDGGIWKSPDAGVTWTNINTGINCHLVERMSTFEYNSGEIVIGCQDNSSYLLSGGNWTSIGGTGDGETNVIDYSNGHTIFTSTQNGSMAKSTDEALDYNYNVGPASNGAWTTPFVQSSLHSTTMFAGYASLFKSTQGGNAGTWTAISPDYSGGGVSMIEQLAVDNSEQTIYIAVAGVKMYKTTNGGTAWTDITAGLPVANAKISRIFISPANPTNVWVTFNGYSTGNKIFFSGNGGSTWTNFSGTLPNIPVLSGIYDYNSTNQTVYIGTDIGVFVRDNTTNDWNILGTGMPNIPVQDLKITYSALKLRAGTRGRGVWEIPINTSPNPPSAAPCIQVVNSPSLSHTYQLWYNGTGTGYIFGQDVNNITENAEFYTPDGSYSHVMGASLNFFHAVTSNPATSVITVKMWKNDGPNGAPGTVLSQKNVLISKIMTDVGASAPTQVYFNTPVPATSPYYIGFDVNYISGDTVGLLATNYGAPATNTAFINMNNVWQTYVTVWGAGYNLSMAAYGLVGTVPGSAFSASPVSGSPGTVVGFTNSTTNGSGFSWTFTGGTPAASYFQNPSVTYSTAGAYDVKLVSYGSCFAKDSITKKGYINIGASQVTATATPVSCFGGSNGAITLSVSGTGNVFKWSNGATTQNLSGLAIGTYTVTVNAGANQSTATATVTQPAVLSAVPSIVSVQCNGGNSGSIDLGVSGGTVPYTYMWSTGATGRNINGITAGSYQATVTDSKGCSLTQSASVTQPTLLSLSSTVTNTTCGSSNGAIALTVSGATSPYTYSWSSGVKTQNISSLSAGGYTVTVTDARGCSASTAASVTQPSALAVSTGTITSVTCNGGATGGVAMNVSAGSTPYTYSWSNGATTENLSSVTAGTYNFSVTDAAGCQFNTAVTITQPAAMAVVVSGEGDVSCGGGSNGSISIGVSGGSTPYAYKWTGSTATTKDLTNLSAGNYVLTVTDASGCSQTRSVTVNQPAVLSGIVKTIVPVSCNGGHDGSVSMTINGGVAPYTYNWNSGATSQNITGVLAGTYNLTVTDKNGCQSVVNATVNQPSATSATIAGKVNVSCNGASTGSVNLTVSGGISPYKYSWSNGASTQSLATLKAGAYGVTVTDNNSCTAYTSTNLTQPSALAVWTTSITNVSCSGGANGSVAVADSGGTAPYTYLWSSGAVVNNPSGLTAGTYTVTVTSTGGCTITTTAAVTQPAGLGIALSAKTNIVCNGGNSGSINVNVSGGSAPYTYQWSNGGTTQNISGLSAGGYTLTVTGAGGCFSTFSTSLSQPAALAVTVSNQTNVSCGGSTGTISITSSGGTLPYSYLWTNGATTQNVSGLGAGVYSVKLTDASGCTATVSATITQPGALTAVFGANTPVSCNGGANGGVTITPSGGGGTYTYNWSSGATTQNLSAVAAGTYTLTLTDNTGCSYTSPVTITQPQVLVATVQSHVDASCNGGMDGSINLSVTGGNTPYTYLWSNAGTVSDISGLAAAGYTVTVTSTGGCTATATATIGQPTAITVTPAITNVICNGGNTGAIALTVAGGTPGYTYNWSTGATTKNLSTLKAGTYVLSLTDVKGCAKTISSSVTAPLALSATVSNVGNANCNTNNGGSVTISVTGGTPAYTYNWSNGTTSQNIQNLSSGSYTATVSDASLCNTTVSASVSLPPNSSVSILNKKDVTCHGDSNGAINIGVSGGVPPYAYQWSSGAKTQDLSGLKAGTYNLSVTNGAGCSQNATVIIGQPATLRDTLIKTDVLCHGAASGALALTISGGTVPYTYSWSSGTTAQNAGSLMAGTYSVTVRDAAGCALSASTTLTEPSAIAVTTASQTGATCGSKNGSANITVSGGTSPYIYSWSNGALTQNISSLAAGDYSVVVKDAGSCSVSYKVTITQPSSLSATVAKTDVSCNGASNGSLALTASGGTSPYSYSWSSGSSSATLSSMPAGTYTATVSDASACSFIISGIINQPVVITAGIASVKNASCYNLSDGGINLNVTGGTTPYSYSWSSGATTQNLSALAAGTYSVSITDAKGCSSALTGSVTQPLPFSASVISHIDVTCNGAASGSINLSVSGATVPYTYNWTNGDTVQDPGKLKAGVYSVNVTSSAGCKASASVTITEPPAVTVSIKTQTNVSCGGGNGAVTIGVLGGTSPYSYNWSNGALTQNISALAAGGYTVTATDSRGCSATGKVIITQSSGLSLSMTSPKNVSCNGGSNGSIAVLVSGGATPYTYSWSSGGTASTVSALAAGSYTVTVKDAGGCSSTLSAAITQPAIISTSIASQVNVSCNGGNTGSVSISASGGTSPYMYSWSSAQSSSLASGLSAGTYSVTVSDAMACSHSAQVTITQPSALSVISGGIVANSSCVSSSGSVSITVSGGTPAYTYSWSNGSTTQNISALQGGVYVVTVSDAGGCSKSLASTVTQPGSLAIGAGTIVNASCNGNLNGSVSISPSGGTGSYTYLWSSGATSENITGLGQGTYVVSVTDAAGCHDQANFMITQPAALSAVISTSSAITCNGASNGALAMTVSGGTSSYTYNWSNGQTVKNPSSLLAGTYSVTITDAHACTVQSSYTLADPMAFSVSIIGQGNVSCNGGSNGSVNAGVSGGTSPYSYFWSSGQTSEDLSNVSAGTYSVTVGDAGGCTSSTSVTLSAPAKIGIVTTPANVSVNGGSSGIIVTSLSGGTPPYVYLWSDAKQTQNDSSLVAGTYTVTVKDAMLCSQTATATITQPSPLSHCSGTTNLVALSDTFSDGSGYKGYSSNADCRWLIDPPNAASITLTFLKFRTELGADSLTVYDGADTTAPILGSYSGSSLPYAIASSGGAMYLHFTSNSSVNDSGWVVSYQTTALPATYCKGTTSLTGASGSFSDGSGSNNYNNNSDCKWLIQPAGATAITLGFTAFSTENGFDFVTVYDGADTSASVLGSFTGQTIPDSITSSGGAMLVWFTSDYSTTDSGWTANYHSYTTPHTYCSGTTNLTAPSGSFEDGSGTGNYGPNSNCKWLIQPVGASSITLSFGSFYTEQDSDWVKVYDGATTGSPLLGSFSGDSLPANLTSSGGSMLVVFTSNKAIQEQGWFASYNSTITVAPYCSGTTGFTAASGSFSDGSGPNDYANNSNCQWLIQPAGATVITLTMDSLATEYGYDFVNVYQGTDTLGTLLASFTGSSIPAPVTVIGGAMLVQFSSDYSGTAAGWYAHYTSSTGAPSYCSGTTTLTADSGQFNDGSGTVNNYFNNADCYWLIQPPGASSIALNFTSFATVSDFDSVYVYDGATKAASLLGSFTGHTIPATLLSTGGSMLVHFVSSPATSDSGWTAYYTALIPAPVYCSGTTNLTLPTDTFTNGSGTNNYQDNARCKWLIQPTGATRINLNFTSFATESGFDFVNVYDGVDTLSPLLGSFSGFSIPSQVSSTGGNMLVQFVSDVSNDFQGWSAYYDTSHTAALVYCSGTTTITDSVNCFSNGSGSNNYQNNANCKWLIQPAGATGVTLTFNSFATEDGFDFVYVYDGSDTTAPLIGAYTGGTLPSVVNSSTGSLLVQFTSDASGTDLGWSACYTITTASKCAIALGVTSKDISCNGNADGMVAATPTGGTGLYSYFWSSGDTTASVSGLIAGTYTITVNDAKGCFSITSALVQEPAVLTANAGTGAAMCLGSAGTAIGGSPSGGTSPYTYGWLPASGLSLANIATPVAAPASSVTYTETVTDANGCLSTDSVLVMVSTPVKANFTPTTATVNLPTATVNFVASLTAGTANSWLWNFGDSTAKSTLQNPAHTYTLAGTYTVSLVVGDSICPSDTVKGTITVLPPSGVNNIEDVSELRLFPNPAHDALNLECKNARMLQVFVFNTIGQMLLLDNKQESTKRLDLSALPDGMYMLRVQTDKGWVNKPFNVAK